MYATSTDMINRFGSHELVLLSNKDTRAETINQAVLDTALQDAGHRINGYLAGRYPLPLATVPAVLVVLCCDLARHQLYDDKAPEAVLARYEAAIAFLEDVGKGKLGLGVNAEGASPPSQNLAVLESGGSVFGRKQSKGFI